MESYSIYSYSSAAMAYAVLLLLSFFGIKRYASGLTFFIAVLFSFIWSAYSSYNLYNDELYFSSILPFETIRNLSWYIYLLSMLTSLEQTNNGSEKSKFNHFTFLYKYNYIRILILYSLIVFFAELIPDLMFGINQLLGVDFRLISHVNFAVIGLILIEQLYRNTISEQRWAIKFICLGLGGVFIYDFIIYSKSLLFGVISFIGPSSKVMAISFLPVFTEHTDLK